jgi:hypothetical protein
LSDQSAQGLKPAWYLLKIGRRLSVLVKPTPLKVGTLRDQFGLSKIDPAKFKDRPGPVYLSISKELIDFIPLEFKFSGLDTLCRSFGLVVALAWHWIKNP